MGAHFAPPFAILDMSKIEIEALAKLKRSLNIHPMIYMRYLDDFILGPFRWDVLFYEIWSTFNSVNESIQFTVEVPERNLPLNFLDISILCQKDVLILAGIQKNSIR